MNRRYFEAKDVPDALRLLQDHPDAGIVAGGTDIVVGHRSGKKALPETLIAIHRLRELQKVEQLSDGALKIGALVTHQQIEASPKLRERLQAICDASALVGSPATRYAGTIGGNVCNASPAMEVGSPLLIADASVELTRAAGARTVPLNDFLVGPGRTTRKPDELLTAVIIPAEKKFPEQAKRSSAYIRLEYRQAMEIAVVGAAASLVVDANGRCLEAGIAITAVAPTCLRVPAAEKSLTGRTLDADALDAAAEAAASAAKPIDDVRGSADYRRAMVSVIVRQALDLALQRAGIGSKTPVPA
jgi:CO/xanthine dehydrogenase FAD-binding subunit